MTRSASDVTAEISPEDAVVIAEVLRRVRDAVGRLGLRADGNLNQADLYTALDDDYTRALKEAGDMGRRSD